MTNNVKPSVVFLRGIDARITLAKAAGICDNEDRAMAVEHAEVLAEVQGREDFIRGRDAEDVPPLLADVAELASAWADGWDAAGESAAITVCSWCNDGSGNPCPHHG